MMKTFKYERNYLRDRDEKIIELCTWKKVLHIGACDSPFTKERQESGDLLFSKIEKVASEQLWIDIDTEMIEYLNSIYGEGKIIYFDMNKLEDLDFKPDIIIFWEVIEHLMNIEVALTNLKKVMWPETILLISTPNAFHIRNFIRLLFWFEHFHSDHKVLFSLGYLVNLLNYNWCTIDKYYFTYIKTNWNKFLMLLDKFIWYIVPWLASTLLVLVKK